jgi:hypothetical protein
MGAAFCRLPFSRLQHEHRVLPDGYRGSVALGQARHDDSVLDFPHDRGPARRASREHSLNCSGSITCRSCTGRFAKARKEIRGNEDISNTESRSPGDGKPRTIMWQGIQESRQSTKWCLMEDILRKFGVAAQSPS